MLPKGLPYKRFGLFLLKRGLLPTQLQLIYSKPLQNCWFRFSGIDSEVKFSITKKIQLTENLLLIGKSVAATESEEFTPAPPEKYPLFTCAEELLTSLPPLRWLSLSSIEEASSSLTPTLKLIMRHDSTKKQTWERNATKLSKDLFHSGFVKKFVVANIEKLCNRKNNLYLILSNSKTFVANDPHRMTVTITIRSVVVSIDCLAPVEVFRIARAKAIAPLSPTKEASLPQGYFKKNKKKRRTIDFLHYFL